MEKIIKAIEEKKGKDIVILELKKFNTFTDYFVICTANSDKHAQTIADFVLENINRGDFLGMEGYRDGKWILIDCDDIVVHIFQEDTREFYDLEGLWYDAERIDPKKYGL